MIDVQNCPTESDSSAILIMQVHDELVLEVGAALLLKFNIL